MAQIPGATISVPTISPSIYPKYLAAASDGVWFTDERFTPHKIGFFTRAGVVSLFEIPCDGCQDASRITYIESITVGPDGNAWFPYTRVASDGSPIDGGMNNYVGRVTRQGVFASFPIPTKDAFRRFVFAAIGHSFITTGPDGALWFTENSANKIGRISTAGDVTEFALPQGNSSPSGITSGPDGNLWVAVTLTGRIAKVTPTGEMTLFPLATNSGPYAIITGPDGNLWFTGASRIARITTAGVVTVVDLPGKFPLHLIAAPDGNLWYTLSNQTIGRLHLPLPASGPATIDSAPVAPNTPYDIVFTSGVSSIPPASIRPQQESIAQIRTPQPIRPPMTHASFTPESAKRRAVSPHPAVWTGHVVLTLTMTIDSDMRAILEQSPQILSDNQLTLTTDGLKFPLKAAIGYRVTVDDQTAMTSMDGTFRLAAAPLPGSIATARSADGSFAKSFRSDEFIAIEGTTPEKTVEIALTLSSGPNGMNDYPKTTIAAAAKGNVVSLLPQDAGFPCGSHAGCTPAACPAGRCCLDYNGYCADTPLARWSCNPLRLQQFIGSTCGTWVLQGCCLNEGAIVAQTKGEKGPGCYDNHRGRECQNIDPTHLALQFTNGEHVENVPAPDVREHLELERSGSVTGLSVPCGGNTQLVLHNNTCDNNSLVTLNDELSREDQSVFCTAGGSISPSGTVPHFSQLGVDTESTEDSAAYRHIVDRVIVYTAPSSISKSCNEKGTDLLLAAAGGRFRHITISVDCSHGVATPPHTLVQPVFTPPPGIYEKVPDVTITTTDSGVEMHYTTDGTVPNINSPLISNGGSITLDGSATVYVRSFSRTTGQIGPITEGDYKEYRLVAALIKTKPEGKSACEPLTVIIGTAPAVNDETVSYTTDGSAPSQATAIPGVRFEVSIKPPGPVTVKAQAYAPFKLSAPADSFTYEFDCPTAGAFDVWVTESDPELHDLLMRASYLPLK